MRWVRNEKLMLESRPDEWSIDARARDANRHFQQSDQLAIAWACVTTNSHTCHAPPRAVRLAIRVGGTKHHQSSGFALRVAGGLKLDLQFVEIFLRDPGDVAAGRPAVQFPCPLADPGLEEG